MNSVVRSLKQRLDVSLLSSSSASSHRNGSSLSPLSDQTIRIHILTNYLIGRNLLPFLLQHHRNLPGRLRSMPSTRRRRVSIIPSHFLLLPLLRHQRILLCRPSRG